jgi:hypothetical protein
MKSLFVILLTLGSLLVFLSPLYNLSIASNSLPPVSPDISVIQAVFVAAILFGLYHITRGKK